MKKNLLRQFFGCFVVCLLAQSNLMAQFTLTGQVRTRSELRDGQGTLTTKGEVPAFFTSQRTRLNFGYGGYRFKLFAAVQDVRVWGQDASTTNRNTLDAYDGLMLHEAWGEIMLLDTTSKIENFSLKIGRQELVYDDSRLLGNLDWSQQARRHDMALLKFANKGWQAHLGVAFNQNRELNAGNVYNGIPTGYTAGTNGIGTSYKSMEFLHVNRKTYFGNVSFLYLTDQFNKYTLTGTAPNVTRTNVRGVWSRSTVGVNVNATLRKKLAVASSAFYQGGKDKDGAKMDAYFVSLSTSYAAGRKISFGPGVDYLSGNDGTKTAETTNRRFDPLYGTPHKFWGYMDYFYVASPFGRGGLFNYYLKSKYKAKDKLFFTLDLHQFASGARLVGNDSSKKHVNLGTELDFITNYSITKAINLEFGYSTMFATSDMASPAVKNVANAKLNNNWAYLMISIKPDFLAK